MAQLMLHTATCTMLACACLCANRSPCLGAHPADRNASDVQKLNETPEERAARLEKEAYEAQEKATHAMEANRTVLAERQVRTRRHTASQLSPRRPASGRRPLRRRHAGAAARPAAVRTLLQPPCATHASHKLIHTRAGRERFLRVQAREQQYSKYNAIKIHNQWRKIMRMTKVDELRSQIEIVSQNHEREVDRKDAVIQMLDRDLEDAEEQFSAAVQGSTRVAQQMLDLQYQRMQVRSSCGIHTLAAGARCFSRAFVPFLSMTAVWALCVLVCACKGLRLPVGCHPQRMQRFGSSTDRP